MTKNRTEGSVSPFSGMCVTCVDGCIGMCEIGKSAYRGAEVLYPQPFGIITAGAEKDYPYDLSHFSIMGTAVGAYGVEADSDKATFEKVTVETPDRRDKAIKLRVPFVIPGMGSTNVAKNNWEGLAIGAAISGAILTVGENVAAMDEGRRSRTAGSSARPTWRTGSSSSRTGRTTATAPSSSRPTSKTPGSASRNTPSRSWASRPSSSSGARGPRTSAARSRSRA